ncbi:rhodanese-like domain-containing protein [Lentilactobacillus kribbianus]|uniref:rhodanese-like domain-containing protein n=1 Tax=Lentilactobacillus kribbianus TaxID=2729622 RepID=UPI001557D325|nr:rhodanese-like domain-containing protein [Lentilactobacillus kribbianus]
MFSLFHRIPSISTTELTAQIKRRPTLLDVRTATEYRSGHIAIATNWPLAKINQYKRQTSEPIYLICQSGRRSKQAAKILRTNGYQVINVRGGMNSWTGPIRSGK